MTKLDDKLDFYVKNNLNVLFEGKHGIGKSSIILDCFTRNNLKFLYFSTSTMDPWVDFIGIPKEKKAESGHSYIDLIRPKAIADDTVEAIFFDEFNRSPKKVRNAVMELLQFKSINGKKLSNLKIIWGAINPDDDEDDLKFDVEKLDPAQRDRFHAHIYLPYAIDIDYFNKKYGPTITDIVNRWWKDLDKDIKNKVSPRRMEYALDIFKLKGDLRDVLPGSTNIGKLISSLKTINVRETLTKLLDEKDTVKLKEFLQDKNTFFEVKPIIEESNSILAICLPLLDDETITSICSKEKDDISKSFILNNKLLFKDALDKVVAAGTNKKLVSIIEGKSSLVINKKARVFAHLVIDESSTNKLSILDIAPNDIFYANTSKRMKLIRNLQTDLTGFVNFRKSVLQATLSQLSLIICGTQYGTFKATELLSMYNAILLALNPLDTVELDKYMNVEPLYNNKKLSKKIKNYCLKDFIYEL